MTAVWVVRNRHGDIVHIASQEPYGQPASYTVTRETILSPAHAAVIAAAVVAEQTLADMAHAEAIYGGQIKDDVLALIDALVALRVQKAQP